MSLFPIFGEHVPGFDVPVLNEREARAGAGILFVFASMAFAQAWFNGNMLYTKIFIVAFFIDFALRVLVHPRYAPSLIIGRFFVQNQTPEYVGAIQKRFAWGIGLLLASIMLALVVGFNTVGPLPMAICILCLFLMFFETAFGICLGCKIYGLISKEPLHLCPGGICETHIRAPIQDISWIQYGVVGMFAVFIATLFWMGAAQFSQTPRSWNASPEGCAVPEWAKSIGHEDLYKIHHGCE